MVCHLHRWITTMNVIVSTWLQWRGNWNLFSVMLIHQFWWNWTWWHLDSLYLWHWLDCRRWKTHKPIRGLWWYITFSPHLSLKKKLKDRFFPLFVKVFCNIVHILYIFMTIYIFKGHIFYTNYYTPTFDSIDATADVCICLLSLIFLWPSFLPLVSPADNDISSLTCKSETTRSHEYQVSAPCAWAPSVDSGFLVVPTAHLELLRSQPQNDGIHFVFVLKPFLKTKILVL